MPPTFDLVITANHERLTAELRLLDAHGSQLAYQHADFKSLTVSQLQGLFDLRNFLGNYVEAGKEAASIAELGVSIAEQVLGPEIFRRLWASESQRSLRIQLPGARQQENHLAAALARVPWEIARPAAGQPTLGERGLLVRVVHDMPAPASQPLDLGRDESLRVLFVFAEARGSRPLAARLERRVLRRLFEKEIYPQRRIVADFLTHGVTRERLQDQIEDVGGYHVVHWSGHGHLNLLELAKPGGGSDRLSGDELLDLFGGFVPHLFFLSACHSGDILRIKDWTEFLALAQGKEPGTKSTSAEETRDLPLPEEPGYTGTAHALLQGGVPSVVAMRYAVGDEYARDLAVEFYDALLGHTKPKTVAEALSLARKALLDPKKPEQARYASCDHATPVLYGAEQLALQLPKGRSAGLDTRNRRLHQIAELTPASHEHFVGRTWELAGLGSDFIGSRLGAEVKPVAVITGLGGMGKTALVAEVLALWESRFEWVLLYQAKPNALGFESTLRDLHMKLYAELGRYHEQVKAHPADAIHRAADAEFTGPERLDRLTINLVRALRDEPILLVLDNFETNLKPQAEPGKAPGPGKAPEPGKTIEPLWACQDPAWDRCLARLAEELAGTASRLLVTCRKPIAALVGPACHQVLLGPLPPREAALYLREHTGLAQMAFGGGEERKLALRLLEASRFHPLLMDRLARLATGGPALRPQLLQALEALESSHDHSRLPALFATEAGAKDLAYLNDALAASLDQLIADAGPDARRLLWMIAVANEPVTYGLLLGAWSGETFEHERLRRMKEMLDELPGLPPELQEELKAMPPEVHAAIAALPPAPSDRPDPAPLLRHLVAVGLATEERSEADDSSSGLFCHELVRERIGVWMNDHPEDRRVLTEDAIRLAYAERLQVVFEALQHESLATALEAGSRALVYCVQAEAWDRLANFAGGVVVRTSDPRLLEALLPHLEAAAESAPEGRARWSCLSCLADALQKAGRPDASLPLYEQATIQVRAVAGEAGQRDRPQAWADLAAITGNWAGALRLTGDLDGSRQRHLESAEAERQAGRPAVHIIGSELAALRIDILQGRAEGALPEVELRLARVEAWWQQLRAGKRVPEAPNPEILARVLITALDIANDADRARGDFRTALRRTDSILEVTLALQRPPADIAQTRMNRAVELVELARFGEARAELEVCLAVFQNDPTGRAKVLGALANLFAEQGDVAQAVVQHRRALALREQLPDPSDRAISHHNLANNLERLGTPAELAESRLHRLADLIYCVVSGLGESLQTSLKNYVVRFHRAHSAGTTLAVPSVAALLADPAFQSLADWLRLRQVDPAEVQAALDQWLEMVRQAGQARADASEGPSPEPPGLEGT